MKINIALQGDRDNSFLRDYFMKPENKTSYMNKLDLMEGEYDIVIKDLIDDANTISDVEKIIGLNGLNLVSKVQLVNQFFIPVPDCYLCYACNVSHFSLRLLLIAY